MKSTPPFVPGAAAARTETLAEWRRLQDGLAAVTHEAAGVDLTKAMVTSPFNEKLRYNAYSGLRILVAHQRRHLLQAEEALATIQRQHR